MAKGRIKLVIKQLLLLHYMPAVCQLLLAHRSDYSYGRQPGQGTDGIAQPETVEGLGLGHLASQ